MELLTILQEKPVYAALAVLGMILLYYIAFGRKNKQTESLEKEYQEILTLEEYKVKGRT
ncbi:hypothetical protein HZB00_01705 [Candidatus Woesearchaeota archaeon]|nr:hypothetical protein [Candidatus Woesearchaeota archaeon]